MDIPNPAREEKIQAPLLVIGILFVLTIGTSFLPASWFGIENKVTKYQPLNLGSLASIANEENDTDRDGIISWKEFVSQSLAIAPETAAEPLESDPRAIAALNDPNNLTSSFSKNLYIASAALTQNGIADEEKKQEAVTQLLAQEAARITPTTYTSASVRTGSDTSAALKQYGNTMAGILRGLITEKTITDDLTSITIFVQSENEGDLLPLVKNTKRVGDALDKLLAVTVPPSAVVLHVDVLNRIGTFAATLENLANANDDPVRATLTIEKYGPNATEALRATPLLANFFKTKNSVFSAQEAGYLFTSGYTNQ